MIETLSNTLLHDRSGPVATVTLHRPQALNALNASMFNELEAVFAALAADPGVRVILLTGSGERAFAAGADIRELVGTDTASGQRLAERGKDVLLRIERCGKPVIACLNGVAFGGGCELALACTLRLASEGAQLGLPEVKLGLIPGYGGTKRLSKLIGPGASLRAMLTGESIGAAEALRLGLVQEVVPGAELMPRAHALALTISRMAPLAVAGVLACVQGEHDDAVDQGYRLETEIFGRLCGTEDKHEGLTAFLEKRRPVWRGV